MMMSEGFRIIKRFPRGSPKIGKQPEVILVEVIGYRTLLPRQEIRLSQCDDKTFSESSYISDTKNPEAQLHM